MLEESPARGIKHVLFTFRKFICQTRNTVGLRFVRGDVTNRPRRVTRRRAVTSSHGPCLWSAVTCHRFDQSAAKAAHSKDERFAIVLGKLLIERVKAYRAYWSAIRNYTHYEHRAGP